MNNSLKPVVFKLTSSLLAETEKEKLKECNAKIPLPVDVQCTVAVQFEFVLLGIKSQIKRLSPK